MEQSASDILRQHGVEIDLGDHRPPEEIVIALGLVARVGIGDIGEEAVSL